MRGQGTPVRSHGTPVRGHGMAVRGQGATGLRHGVIDSDGEGQPIRSPGAK
jgi:hypothetical protein